MGLDMYAYTTAEKVETDTDFFVEARTEIAYWHKFKFNALHGWMQNLYYSKGGKSDEFNCDNVRIDLDDLDDLEEVLKEGLLRPVDGFFFGSQTVEPEDVESAQEFIGKARAAIAEGLTVYYLAWR